MNWKPVVGYELLYEVSDYGDVRSRPREGRGKRKWYGGKVLRQHISRSNGYCYLTLCDDVSGRARVSRRVHVLVLRAFVGEPPLDKQHGRHLNGNKTDNRLCNLAYGSASENAADRKLHGTSRSGADHPCAKLTKEQRAEVCAARGIITQIELARRYGVTQAAISAIQRATIEALA